MRYIDPDGKSAYAIKVGKNEYQYKCSWDIFGDLGGAAIDVAADFLPGFGSLIYAGSKILYGKVAGIVLINDCKNWGDALISGIGAPFGAYISNANPLSNFITKRLKYDTELLKFMETFGTVATFIGRGADVVSFFLVFSHRQEIELDQVIEKLVGKNLTAPSAIEVRYKYEYAKMKIQDLIANGGVSYWSDWRSHVTDLSYDQEMIKELRSRLDNMK